MKKKVINYYASFYEVSKELNQKQFYEFNNAIFSVMFYEQHIDGISFNDKMLNMLWLSIKHSLQASIDGYCSKNKIVYKDTLTKGLTNNDNDKGKDKGKDKENTQVRKLSAQDVINYCKERNNSIDGEYFFDYYESADWVKSNGQKVKDWKATVRMWEKREQNNKTEQQSQRKVLSR